MSIIEVRELTRHFPYYEKDEGVRASFKNLLFRRALIREAVRAISFDVEEGEVVGFLGPNGAGKTTTLKMLAGIMHPTSGEASVMGHTPWLRKKDFRMQISIVMGQRSQLWPDLPAIESFELNRAIYEIPRHIYDDMLKELVELFEIGELLRVQVRRLSLGERMKMELIAALLHRPRVLFLDEPTIGLDILSQRAMREIVREMNRRYGTTIILTSHYLSDIQDLCRRVILINHGQIVYDGLLSRVNASLADHKNVRLTFSEEPDERRLAGYPGMRERDGLTVTFEVPRSGVREFSRQVLDELPVIDLTIEEVPIEEGITRLYRGESVD